MKLKVVMVTLVSLIAYLGCTKVAMKPPEHKDCIPKFPDKQVTYNGYVKNILSIYCYNCHSGGGPGPGNFTTYSGVVEHTHSWKIRVLSDNADMPQGDAPLPQNIRDSLAYWIGNCTPEK